ncbi:MAG: DEAD/DEAH box helicase [Pseudonocardiales bacterium]|nr:DEAD/DEAH box helicase [Pseudonocardiales bacterium]MBV9029137.1 DEAD/DEAH box helicase [Pseudonocardiales bacterium]
MATFPAEAHAAARRRAAFPRLDDFAGGLSFELDPFQRAACEALEQGHGVLVCAPTGAGKTVVGEFAVHLALAQGRKCFYTTPIKALSNQKYADLVARYGADTVGLLTGDTSVNGGASVVVMTTEVLRNMLCTGSPTLHGLAYVVMDEVHYLADRFRGAVWEEVILNLPESVRLVGLSATVSNAEEFGEWLVDVRGDTAVVVDEHRPVPLWQHMMVGSRMFDLFADTSAGNRLTVDPHLVQRVRELERHSGWDRPHRGGSRFRPPARVDVVARLDREALLPAIAFIFSRAGCEAAVNQCVRGGLRLTTPEESVRIRQLVDARTAGLPEGDLGVLGFWEWRDALERGVAAHHAGMLPVFKETVEELFVLGLVRVVFATETLALGINMPARTVVLERLVKFNGEAHLDLTPGEYTQLTGRAGRRGIDVEGHAVVLWQPGVDPAQVAGLACARTYPLRSSFRPGYNMAVNLVDRVGVAAGRALLERSFAQFQADRSVVGLARRIHHNDEGLAGYAESMACHLGEFAEYARLRRQVSERERMLARCGGAARRAEVAESLARLERGDVIAVPGGRRSGPAVVLELGDGPREDPRPLVLTEDGRAARLSITDFPAPVQALGRMRLPKRVEHRVPRVRRDLASVLRSRTWGETGVAVPPRVRRHSEVAQDAELAALRRALRAHPCHGCGDREAHARWAERYDRLDRETDTLRRQVTAATHSLARTFDRIRALLAERGYLEGERLTEHGRRLARLWSETDLLIAECLRHGIWDDLEPAELAAVISALVYEARGDTATPRVPAGPVSDALVATVRLWAELEADERRHRLERTREPDLGFAWPVYRWARGEPLSAVLMAAESNGAELSAGDFVRWCRQVLDVLDQVRSVAAEDSRVGATAADAVRAVRRGVVALGTV